MSIPTHFYCVADWNLLWKFKFFCLGIVCCFLDFIFSLLFKTFFCFFLIFFSSFCADLNVPVLSLVLSFSYFSHIFHLLFFCSTVLQVCFIFQLFYWISISSLLSTSHLCSTSSFGLVFLKNILIVTLCMCAHPHPDVIGQLIGVGASLHGSMQVIRFGSRWPYQVLGGDFFF